MANMDIKWNYVQIENIWFNKTFY